VTSRKDERIVGQVTSNLLNGLSTTSSRSDGSTRPKPQLIRRYTTCFSTTSAVLPPRLI
jgi:hypothetical protein